VTSLIKEKDVDLYNLIFHECDEVEENSGPILPSVMMPTRKEVEKEIDRFSSQLLVCEHLAITRNQLKVLRECYKL